MPEFEVKYHIREPVSRHPQSGAIKFRKDGLHHNPITVSAVDATYARKKAARHPAILNAKERANGSIDSSVQAFGGKARHKVDEVKPKSKTKTKTAIKAKAAIKGGSGTGGTSKPGGVLSMRMPEPKLFDPNKGGRTSRSVRSRTMSLNKNKGGSVKKKAKK